MLRVLKAGVLCLGRALVWCSAPVLCWHSSHPPHALSRNVPSQRCLRPLLPACWCGADAGRLKGPEYVALTTSVYRRAVDAAWDALQAGSTGGGAAAAAVAAATASTLSGPAQQQEGGVAAGSAAAPAAAAGAPDGRLKLSPEDWMDLRQARDPCVWMLLHPWARLFCVWVLTHLWMACHLVLGGLF
jgi:hypothetical protein